jgi:outer membrane protein
MLKFIRPTLTGLTLAIAASFSGAVFAEDFLEIYELARASDPQLRAADNNRLAVGENVVQTRALLLPQINGTAGLEDSENDSTRVSTIPNEDGTVSFGPSIGAGDTRTRTYRVQLTQSVFDWSNYTRLRASRALSSRSDADYDAALDLLVIRAAQAYFGVLTAQSNLDAAEAEEKAVGRQLEQADQRFEVGLTAITDVHEARARYDSARAAVILAKNQLSDAYEALVELTGQRVASVEPLQPEIPLALPEPANPQAWVDVAVTESPTLASRRFALQATEHDIGTARAGHLPTLSAGITYTDQDTWGDSSQGDFNFPATSLFEDTSIGLTLTVPIFSGFATQSRVRQAVHYRDLAGDQLEQERRAVVRTTRNAFSAVEAGMSEIEARKQALVSAQSALDATQAGFEVGTRTIVDVLLSQQQLFAAQREYARARHDFIVSGLTLKQAAGVIDIKDVQAVNALLAASAPIIPRPTDQSSPSEHTDPAPALEEPESTNDAANPPGR